MKKKELDKLIKRIDKDYDIVRAKNLETLKKIEHSLNLRIQQEKG